MRWWTGAILTFGLGFLALVDIFVYVAGGLDATISSIVSGWLGLSWLAGNPLPIAVAAFLAGDLFAHFTGFVMRPEDESNGN